MIAFTISRFVRHCIAAWIGVYYGKTFLRLWNQFSARWAVTILIVFWSITIVFSAIGIWKLVQTSRSMKLRPGSQTAQPTAQ
jgi:hypothetical protein